MLWCLTINTSSKGVAITLYFSPEFMCKTNDPCFIPVVPTGRSEFYVPNCLVRAHRYISEHTELRDGRRRFSIKDSNAGKELSASTISRSICDITVESHATLEKSKSLSKTVKVHEVPAVATSLQLYPRWICRL